MALLLKNPRIGDIVMICVQTDVDPYEWECEKISDGLLETLWAHQGGLALVTEVCMSSSTVIVGDNKIVRFVPNAHLKFVSGVE